MHPRYTLIIPHYNQPQQLERLLCSIPVRADLQVVVADDGSGEGFRERMQSLQMAYPWAYFLLLPENRGGGSARNEALKVTQGEYVLFADADDYFLTDSLNSLLDRYASISFDMLCFDAVAIDNATDKPSSRADRLNWIMKRQSPEREQLLRYQHSEPWCKIVRREIIEKNGIQFDETPILNDVRFSYLVGFHSAHVLVDASVCYCVCDCKGSVGKKMTNERKIAYTRVLVQTNRFFREKALPYDYKRVFRPFVLSILRCEWKDAGACIDELRSGGENTFSIGWNVCMYPVWLFQWLLLKHRYRQARRTLDAV